MFFAGVELLHYPQLKGLPVVVGGRSIDTPRQLADGRWQFARLGDYAGRGVVTTSTYEARALGVFSAMGLMKAAAKAPDAIILPANFDAYRHYSRLFKQAVRDIAPHVEDRGIDEIYIDLSEHTEPSQALAQRLKDAVYSATGLTCSICIAPNKLLAKIGSELDKPDGLTLLDESSLQSRIWPLSVSKINGIGPKAVAKLATISIHTIAELAQADVGLLQSTFGRSYAAWLLNVANGQDHRHLFRTQINKPGNDFRARFACQARPCPPWGNIHQSVRARRPGFESQALYGRHRRHQTALSGFHQRHARPDATLPDQRCGSHTQSRRGMPQAGTTDQEDTSAR